MLSLIFSSWYFITSIFMLIAPSSLPLINVPGENLICLDDFNGHFKLSRGFSLGIGIGTEEYQIFTQTVSVLVSLQPILRGNVPFSATYGVVLSELNLTGLTVYTTECFYYRLVRNEVENKDLLFWHQSNLREWL